MYRHRRTLALCWVALSAAGAADADAQASANEGSVQGMVYDSIADEPLGDAAVFLWNTSYRAVTDARGRFRLDGVPAGAYTVVFYHARLGQMGISAGPRPIIVTAGRTTDVDLGTPSMFTVVSSQCLVEPQAPGTGTLVGWVGDAESGTAMPGASVSLSWQVDGDKSPRRVQLRTDGSGWYRACEAPAGVPIIVSAGFLDREGYRHEVVVAEGGVAEAGFLLSPIEPSHVRGRLVDAESRESVADAEVWLRGTGFRAVTGPDGSFRFGDVPAGTYMMFARHLRYGTKLDTLVVPSGQTISVEMHLPAKAIEIAPITVSVESRPLTERSMGGLTIERAQIDSLRGKVRDVADILRLTNVPGIIVRRDGDTLCIGYMPGQVRMMFRNGCVPMIVFINNVRASNTDLAVQISPEAIDHVTVYRPVEAGNLFGLGAGNGVLAIFTRRR
jgi:Carboxypeptidase regulatory-like domain